MDSLINNINGVSGPKSPAESKTNPQRSVTESSASRGDDSLVVSPRAAELTNLGAARLERGLRIDRIRDQIAADTYVTDHKIDATVNKLFAKLTALDLTA